MLNPSATSKALVAYYVKDSSGTQYADSSWSGPNILPGEAISVNILIDGRTLHVPDRDVIHRDRHDVNLSPVLVHFLAGGEYVDFYPWSSAANPYFL
jgi:hypothetical protein